MGERDVCFNKRYCALDLWPPHLAQEGPGAFGRGGAFTFSSLFIIPIVEKCS